MRGDENCCKCLVDYYPYVGFVTLPHEATPLLSLALSPARGALAVMHGSCHVVQQEVCISTSTLGIFRMDPTTHPTEPVHKTFHPGVRMPRFLCENSELKKLMRIQRSESFRNDGSLRPRVYLLSER